ncbi:Beta-N-acetylhexosaminidase precursor [Paraliobacillus sp. PM-2]|uniref:family 20 glycosylhydrolase n=1 Tax=Paraliobacillus sp. PM-2 TaxID=1462524 RepID=UPI00061C96F8|nr:family 20 glycosylhydrolase [Paraliobacillus sp. PM-2]CQR46509.1 Beta-N-acetylhexosaminidase precursor [Paraliobacillus sp. PM-2]
MRKITVSILSFLMIFSTLAIPISANESNETNEELASLALPIVQSYETTSNASTWEMGESTRFVIPTTDEYINNPRLKEVVELVAAEFLEKEIPTASEIEKVYADESQTTSKDIVVTLEKNKSITEESNSEDAYKIEIGSDGINIVAASENAVLYALRTIQHFMITNNNQLVYGTIIDYPDLAERRVHVDTGRKYFTKEWIIQHIRELSYLKMNTLQLHFSENLGFRIESDFDQEIVSQDGYLKKSEVKEILAEAKKYGINVIPSLDTPGHVEHILKVHPEYGQVDVNGNKSDIALDVTNPEAVEYIKGLYSEYMELFEGSTDFHIGGDEYMEFDRDPFISDYKPVLNDYAKEALGEEYIWKDVLANYINEIAAHVYEGGFKPRIWNDGIYYGETNKNSWEPVEPKQKIVMHDYIGIDFWSQMGWNKSIARLDTFVEKGHKDIYNVNASFFYYVLRPTKPDDGREQHSFDYLNQDERIYNDWTPGTFQDNTVPDDSDYIRGASLAIWNDKPDLVGEDVITQDIAKELRSLASKSWNTASADLAKYDVFKNNYEMLGNVAGFAKGSELPNVQPVKQLETNEDVDKSKLEQAISNANNKEESNFTKDSWKDFSEALKHAKKLVDNEKATQEEVNQAVDTLKEATKHLVEIPAKAVDKSELEQVISKADKKTKDDYTVESWKAFTKVLKDSKKVYENELVSQKEVDEAVKNLNKAEEALERLADRHELPNTATSMFNFLLIGSLLILSGVFVFILKRKKTKML